jgi:tetratricopeptide (TPR) repeat protein
VQNKISVYEEILAMEPGSKLFFPLAKMLVETGKYTQAEKILLQGLGAHPEYFEARLLLLDVLEYLGREDEARGHCLHMLALLKGAQGFWAVWNRILTANGEDDTRTALAFVQASLQGRAITWADVFARGLDSVLGTAEGGRAPAVGSVGTNPDERDAVEASAMHRTAVLAEDHAADTEVVSQKDVPSADLVSAGGTEAIIEPRDVLEEEADNANAPERAAQVQPASVPERREETWLAGADVPVREDILSAGDDLPETEVENTFEPSQDADAEEVDDIAMNSDVRTRTMADLLMQQEEYAQAVVIYEKLWKESAPGSERRELYDALTTARGKMEDEANDDTPPPSMGDGVMDDEGHASSDALRTLSALAERLEQRAKKG